MALDRLFTTEAAAGDIDAALGKARRDGRFSGAGWLTPKAGERIQASLDIQSLRGTDAILGFAVTVGHLATQRQDETELADSEQKFRMLVQGVTDYAIYMIDPRGYITNWNLGGERIKGYRAEEVIGGHFSQFYMPEDRAAGIPARALEIAASEGRYEGEGWRIRKDGTRFWAGVVIDRILDPDGKLVGFAKITRDMTEKRRAEEALEQARAALAQAQKMEAVGQLTGGVAHDFNNLLTVITNSLDLLETRLRPDAQTRRIIDSAQRAAERGATPDRAVAGFFAAPALAPRDQQHQCPDRAGSKRCCAAPARSRSSSRWRSIRSRVAANIDSAQFETALLNLIVNARDAMPKGGSVRISTGRKKLGAAEAKAMSGVPPGDYVTVGVADTGEGMAPEVVSRVFEPFFTTKEVGKGSGLGLSQVYGFVTQSGGHVAIDSKPGAGTTVTLYLPAAPAVAAGRSASDRDATTTPPVGRILIVEDDPEVLDVTVEMLRTLGWEVLTAPDAPSGLSVLRRDADIDVLFSDIVMPRGMNGVELAREARRLRPELRVLLASGYPASALPAGTAGSEDDEFPFLSKPYRASELAQKLRAMQPRARTR